MTSVTTARRLAALEAAHAATTRATCKTCRGRGFALVFVPENADEDDPRYHPTHCAECGMPLWRITRIIGISEDEMLPSQEGGR